MQTKPKVSNIGDKRAEDNKTERNFTFRSVVSFLVAGGGLEPPTFGL